MKIALIIASGLVGLALGTWWMQTYGVVDECRGAPAIVDYRPGMTLCPGQAARIRMECHSPIGDPTQLLVCGDDGDSI